MSGSNAGGGGAGAGGGGGGNSSSGGGGSGGGPLTISVGFEETSANQRAMATVLHSASRQMRKAALRDWKARLEASVSELTDGNHVGYGVWGNRVESAPRSFSEQIY